MSQRDVTKRLESVIGVSFHVAALSSSDSFVIDKCSFFTRHWALIFVSTFLKAFPPHGTVAHSCHAGLRPHRIAFVEITKGKEKKASGKASGKPVLAGTSTCINPGGRTGWTCVAKKA